MDFDPNFYKNTSAQDVLAFLPKPVEKEKPKGILSSAGEFLGDMGDVYGAASGDFVKGVANLVGPKDNIVAEIGQDAVNYWNARKSKAQNASDAQFQEVLQDPNKDWTDVVSHLALNPRQLASQATQSAPAMAVGMGAGGLLAKGLVKAGLMVDAAGNLTAVGSRVAAGAGEGLAMAPDINEATKGQHAGESTLAGIALGILTNVVTPGSPVTSAVRRMSHGAVDIAEDSVANFANRSVARRVLTGTLAEGAQESSQEYLQAQVEQGLGAQAISGNDLAKRVAVAGVLGATMGSGMHPVSGEGAPRFATQDEKTAYDDQQKNIRTLAERVKLYQGQADNSSDPVILAQATAAQAAYLHAVAPSPQTEAALNTANAVLQSKLNPASQSAKDAADMARGEQVVNANPDPVVIRDALHEVTQVGVQNILDAPTENGIDDSINVFAHSNDSSPAVSTIPASISAVRDGLNTHAATLENTRVADATINEEAFAPEIETPEQAQKRVARETDEARKAEKHRLQMEVQTLRLQREQAKTAEATSQTAADPVATARDGYIRDIMETNDDISLPEAEEAADTFVTYTDQNLRRFIDSPSPIPARKAFAQAILNQRQGSTAAAPASTEQAEARTPLEQARETYIRNQMQRYNQPREEAERQADAYETLTPAAHIALMNDTSGISQAHEQAYSREIMNQRNADDQEARGDGGTEEIDIPGVAGFDVTDDPQHPGTFHVIHPDGGIYDTYSGQNALEHAQAVADFLNKQDHEQATSAPMPMTPEERALADARQAYVQHRMNNARDSEETANEVADSFDQEDDEYLRNVGGPGSTYHPAVRGYANAMLAQRTATANLNNAPAVNLQDDESPRTIAAIEDALAAGINTDRLEQLQEMTIGELKEEFNDILNSPEERKVAHSLLLDGGIEPGMINAAQFDAREALYQEGLHNGNLQDSPAVRRALEARDDAYMRDLASVRSAGSNADSQLALFTLALRQRVDLAHVNVDRVAAPAAVAPAQSDPLAAAREAYIQEQMDNPDEGFSRADAETLADNLSSNGRTMLEQFAASSFYSPATRAYSRALVDQLSQDELNTAREVFIAGYVGTYGGTREHAGTIADSIERYTDEQLRNVSTSGSRLQQGFAPVVIRHRIRSRGAQVAAPVATPATTPAAASTQTADQAAAAALTLAHQQYIDARAVDGIRTSEAENAARHYEGRSDEQLVQDLTGSISDAAQQFIQQLQRIRALPGQTPRSTTRSTSSSTNTTVTPTNTVGVRNITQAFEGRATSFVSSGAADKIADFFKTVMRGRGQRVLKAIKIDDLKASFRDAVRRDQQLPLDGLKTLQDRYNAQLKKQAKEWAEAHNQTFDEAAWVNPIRNIRSSSYTGSRGGFYFELAGLNKAGGNRNPYMKNPNSNRFISFGADTDVHAVSLEDIEGGGELAYRFAGDVAQLRGHGIPAHGTLLTVNNYRRSLQTLSATSLGDPNALNPLTSSGQRSGQGMPSSVWNMATPNQRIGLNVLRFAHSTTDGRDHGSGGADRILPTAKIFENLEYKSDGKIYAITNPRWPRGFPKSDQPITQAQILAKIGEPDEHGRTAYPRDSGYGGVGVSSAKFAIMLNTAINFAEQHPGEDIPAWMATVAKQAGRENEGWLFSEGEGQAQTGQSITREEANTRINEMVGESVGKVLTESGLINFVQTQEELTGKTFSDSAGRIQGATAPDGKITLVLDNLNSENFDGVLQHEALHATLKALVGESTYDALMSRLSALLQAGKGSNWVTEAEKRVPTTTEAENHLEEVAAYAIEQLANNSSETNPLVKWAKNFMSALRAAIIKSKSVPEALRTWAIKNLQAADLQKLAVAGLRAKGEGQVGEVLTSEAKSEGASYGTPTEGAVSVQGVHYSSEQRNVLNTDQYGTGIKGAEAERLAGEENSDIRPRTHFYVDQGNGVEKEPGVGSYGHMTQLNNLYDAANDPLKLRSNDTNAFERAVIKSGYDGFYDAKNGNAVVIGDHAIPTEKYVPGTNISEAYLPKVDTFRENLQKSKFPGGQMLGREWSVALKGSEFDTKSVQEALKERAGEMIYRDDIPRFNDGMRFSIAEETEANQAPVDEAPAAEVNILGNNRRGLGGLLERFVVKPFQNKHETIRRIQRILGVTKENVDMHVMGALNRMGSRVQTQQEKLIKVPFAKIEAILEAAKFSSDAGYFAMKDYLINNHVTEYNDNVMIVNPARYDAQGNYLGGFDEEHPASGIKSDVAQRAVALVHERAEAGDIKAEAVLDAAKVYREVIRGIQNYAVESGLQKQEVIDVWNKQNPNYVPFIRELGAEEDYTVGIGGGGSGLSTKAGISKRAMGSSAEIVHPLVSTAAFGARTVVRGENAEVGRTLLNFAKNFKPNFMKRDGELKPMWSVDKTQNIRVIKRTNVYRVRLADGSQSPEFYNRAQAQAFANAKQQQWVAQNPGSPVNSSGIITEQIGNGAQARVFVVPQPNNLNAANVVTVPVEGENHIITFDKDSQDGMSIATAMRGAAPMGDSARIVLTPFRMFSHWISTTATGKNPAFMPFNSMYDVSAAMINAGSEKIPGWTAKDSLKIATGFPGAMSQIWKHLREDFVAEHSNGVARPVVKPGSMAEWVDKARAAGGLTGIVDANFDLDDHETQLRRLLGASQLSKPLAADEVDNFLRRGEGMLAKIGDSFYRFGEGEINTKSSVLNWLSKRVVAGVGRMNEAAELATRTLAFKMATEKYIKAGKTEEEALKLAAVFSKNISTNFQNKGNVSGVMNSLFPFFNASMQGTARLGESLFEKGTFKVKRNGEWMTDEKTKLTSFGKKVGGATLFAGIAQALLLAASGYDDDDIPQQVKNRSFVVPIGNNKYVLLPLPHGFRSVVGMGRELTDAVLFHDKALAHIGNATLGQIAGFSPTGSAGNLITDMTPALVDPFFSLASNTDAFGRPIAKLAPDPAHPTPGFTRAKEGASKFGRATAEFMNTISGGNADKAGAMSPTPDQIDFVMGTLTGGVGKFAAGTAGLIGAGANDIMGKPREAIPLHKIPLANRLYGDLDSPAAIHDKMFRVRTELNELDAQRKGMFKRGEREEALALIEEHPEMQIHGQLEAFARRDATQRKNRALARGADEIEKVNAITTKQDARIKELLDRYDEIKARQPK